MQQGPTEQTIIEQCIREGSPLPESIANAPELGFGLDFFMTAFLDLTTTRSVGEIEGPVSWSTVDQYAHRYGVSGPQFDDLWYHVSHLDKAYLGRPKPKLPAPDRPKPSKPRR